MWMSGPLVQGKAEGWLRLPTWQTLLGVKKQELHFGTSPGRQGFFSVKISESSLHYVAGKGKNKEETFMKDLLAKIKEEALAKIASSDAPDKLNEVRINYLGKKGELTSVLKGMKDVSPEDRPKVGQMVNDTREEIETALERARIELERKVREAKMKSEAIDVTLPAKKMRMGHRHPNTIVMEEVERIFVGMGYEVVEGPEVETDYYNF